MTSSRSVYTCARAAVTVALLLILTPFVAQAETISVAAGGDLQAALDGAKAGDTILLQPGATYVGNFTLPVHGGTTYVTVRTGGSDALLPGPGERISPAYSPYLARIQSPNSLPALATRASASFWKIMLLEFSHNLKGQGDVIALGNGTSAQNSLSLVPHDLILDRLYVHGDPLDGQKRGIGLNSASTTIINSYISEMKGIGQDTQAIGGWNGPGPFHIENNYLEAATEVFMLGGDDPKIPNLVPSDLTFRGNVLTRPVSWRDAIMPTPSGITATAGSGGTLAAGTYAYRVVARRPAGTTTATSARSAEVTATAGANGAVTIRWTAVPNAAEYRVYGRGVGSQTMYWSVTGTSFTDTGAAGASGTAPSTGTVWQVKNLFELKNTRRAQIDHNLMENHWAQAQAGPSILLTVRNQYGGCTWCVVEQINFEHNIVRHVAAGVHILGIDYNHPSQQTNAIRIANNEFSDVDRSWGGNGYIFQIGDNPRDITIDHNTMISNWGYGIVTVAGPPVYGFVFTNNIARHNSYGIIGSGVGYGNVTIDKYFPGAEIRRNVIAGGKASLYPPDNLFPTTTEFPTHFVDYAGGNYQLLPTSPWNDLGADGKDLGADYTELPERNPRATGLPRIGTALLPPIVELEAYSLTLEASGGVKPYSWSILDGSLPPGMLLDPLTGVISGAASTAGEYLFTVQVTDARSLVDAKPLALSVARAIPPVQIVTESLASAVASVDYAQRLLATGGDGTYTWMLSQGALPAGVALTVNGDLQGTPASSGIFTFEVTAADAADPLRNATRGFLLSVAPANLKPSVTVTASTTGTVLVGAPVTLTAAASDRDGTVTNVEFFVNGQSAGRVSSAPFTLEWSARDAGPHTITAVATDSADETVTSSAITVIATAEIVLYASDVNLDTMVGNFQIEADATAAGGQLLRNPNQGAAKLAASDTPTSYAEFTFYAEAGRAYHVWMRGKADANSWTNDSISLQFSGTVDAAGTPIYRIATTSAATYTLEDYANAGLSGWGWQDNGFGLNVMGANLYFERTGVQTLRLQQREDGLSIDQIVISPSNYLTESPGVLKNDTTIVTR